MTETILKSLFNKMNIYFNQRSVVWVVMLVDRVVVGTVVDAEEGPASYFAVVDVAHVQQVAVEE